MHYGGIDKNGETGMKNAFQAVKRWMVKREKGISMSDYFAGYPYQSIAIYGADEVGMLLLHEIRESLPVKYIVDKGAESIGEMEGIPVVLPCEITRQEKVDAMIVADLLQYQEILLDLIRQGIHLPAVCLKDIIFEM